MTNALDRCRAVLAAALRGEAPPPPPTPPTGTDCDLFGCANVRGLDLDCDGGEDWPDPDRDVDADPAAPRAVA